MVNTGLGATIIFAESERLQNIAGDAVASKVYVPAAVKEATVFIPVKLLTEAPAGVIDHKALPLAIKLDTQPTQVCNGPPFILNLSFTVIGKVELPLQFGLSGF